MNRSDAEKFRKSATFSQIIPQYANSPAVVRKLAHLRHALRFGHKPPATCRARAILRLRFQGDVLLKQLLNGVGAAAGAGRTVLALFELEGQHIEQAIDPVGERFEQRLLFERRDVEMKTKEVDERSAAQTALLDDRAPCLVRGLAQVAEEHLA